jgi:hypothetical protein
MPNLNVPFAGQTLIIPGAYYADNVSQALIPAPGTTPPLIFIGFGYGQQPFIPATYDNPNDLLAAIRGGPCSGFVQFLTQPSPQLFGAQQITYINASENTQSSAQLSNGSSGVINMQSTNYGLPSNLLQISVVNATDTNNAKKVTLFDGAANRTFVGDDLGVPFQLAYTGAATGVTYTVSGSGATNTAVNFITTSPNSGESVNISLAAGAFSTVEQVVEYLNGTGFYNATILHNDGAFPASGLNVRTAVALTSGLGDIRATLTDIVWWLNNFAGGLVTATIPGGIVNTIGSQPLNQVLTPFSGAASVPPTLADYASGLNAALAVPGWSVFIDSNASGVIALGVAHANSASSPVNGKWRRFFTGSTSGMTTAQAVAQAQQMASSNATFVYPGIYAINLQTGLNTFYTGLSAAAMVAGMATGNAVATPLTNKALSATGVETQLTVSQIDNLQQNGVMPLWQSPQTNLPTIVSDLTTWQLDANPENVFNQQIACRDYLAYSVINTLNPYVGTIADNLTEQRILTAVKTMLNALLYSSGNNNAVLNSWDPRTLKLVYNGQQQLAAITVNVIFVGQNRFITTTVNVLPLQITLSATA